MIESQKDNEKLCVCGFSTEPNISHAQQNLRLVQSSIIALLERKKKVTDDEFKTWVHKQLHRLDHIQLGLIQSRNQEAVTHSLINNLLNYSKDERVRMRLENYLGEKDQNGRRKDE